MRRKLEPLPETQILGWTGATALVLAVDYLIRLALDTGWLTPERPLTLAVMSAFSLIGTGLWLRHADREYANLLPAGGLVMLFLPIYGAHLYYHCRRGDRDLLRRLVARAAWNGSPGRCAGWSA